MSDQRGKRNAKLRRASKPRNPGPRYTHLAIQTIASALKVPPEQVHKKRGCLESAAEWYCLDAAAPDRVPPSITRKRLVTIKNAATKLLRHCGIKDASVGFDEPDLDVIEALANGDPSLSDVEAAIEKMARLSEILDGLEAARNVVLWSSKIHDEGQVSSAASPRRRGDRAVQDWAAAMLGLYEPMTGKKPGPGPRNAQGHVVKFLAAAGEPLGIQRNPTTWRDLVISLLNMDKK